MRKHLHSTWLFVCVCMMSLVGFLLISCGRSVAPESSVSPLSPVATPSAAPETGQVYAAQIRGAWAPGVPYPVFFFDVPRGTTKVDLEEVVYGTEAPLGGVHPRLARLAQKVVWPGASTSQILATDFSYDETAGLLLMFNATLDGAILDTASYDVFSGRGVGIAYLGDAGGANVFYNCASPASIHYQELAKTEEGKPAEALFNWECEGDTYEVRLKMTWGKSDPVNNIDVITELTATITRK